MYYVIQRGPGDKVWFGTTPLGDEYWTTEPNSAKLFPWHDGERMVKRLRIREWKQCSLVPAQVTVVPGDW